MTLLELTSLLFQEINFNLPGEKSHELMAPYKRTKASSIINAEIQPKLSAVLMLIYPKNDIPHFLSKPHMMKK